MYPDRKEALRLLKEAEKLNPGSLINHSRTVAHCAEKNRILFRHGPGKSVCARIVA